MSLIQSSQILKLGQAESAGAYIYTSGAHGFPNSSPKTWTGVHDP